MDLALAGRRALVTGASRGLGRAIARELAQEGVQVIAVARNLERLQELAASAAAGRGSISVRACDLRDAAAIAGLAEPLAGADILVINTGGPPPGPVADTADATWSAQFEAMFLSAVRLARLALPGMRARGFGRIITVVSSGVIQPIDNLGISNALRAALVGWSKTLAAEVASAGITVNCVAPGRIATDRLAELDRGKAQREGATLEDVQRSSRAGIPAARYGDPAEFAAVVAFIASARASYMTGGIVRVDGGLIRSV
jgi:3-oxoacyl-[acyl-carrier protein] reductase